MRPEEGALLEVFEEQFGAINLLCERGMIRPALVLLYSTIDAAAWLDVPEDANVTKSTFVAWVEKYLLPGSGLDCTSLEVYGARCGVLHSLAAISNLSREGKVRTIAHARGTATVKDLNEMAFVLGKRNMVGIHVDELKAAVRNGFQRFLEDAAPDQDRWSNILLRAQQLFSHLPEIGLTNALNDASPRNA